MIPWTVPIFDNRFASVTSSLDTVLKELHCDLRFRGHSTWMKSNMAKPPLLLLQVLPWVFNATTNDGLLAFFRVSRGNDTVDSPIFDHRFASVTSSLDTVLKELHCDLRFRGHGTWMKSNMAKPPLLLLQVLPWVFNATTNDGLLAFFRVSRGNDTVDSPIFDHHFASVTSSLDTVLKELHCDLRFRGHSTWMKSNMAKPPLLLLQVLPWVFNATTNDGLLAFFRVSRGNETMDSPIFDHRFAKCDVIPRHRT
ncbi:hypothetical protein MTO96_049892 [Rhipicephalus appendiculatus]